VQFVSTRSSPVFGSLNLQHEGLDDQVIHSWIQYDFRLHNKAFGFEHVPQTARSAMLGLRDRNLGVVRLVLVACMCGTDIT
jgi:hypothetical protein